MVLSGAHTSAKAQQLSFMDTSQLNMPNFFINIHTLFPQKLKIKCKDSEKKILDLSLFLSGSAAKVNGAYFWADTHPQSKFNGNPFNCFCVILLTNQQTNKKIWVIKHNLFSGGN